MALSWDVVQGETVETAIQSYPAASHRCVELAQALLPVAREIDAKACIKVIRPRYGRLITPKQKMPRDWHEHVVTHASEHHVDAFTGAPGIEQERYLPTHFNSPEFHVVLDADLATLLAYSETEP